MCGPLNPTKCYQTPIRSVYQFKSIQTQQKPTKTIVKRSAQFAKVNHVKTIGKCVQNGLITCSTEWISEKRTPNHKQAKNEWKND